MMSSSAVSSQAQGPSNSNISTLVGQLPSTMVDQIRQLALDNDDYDMDWYIKIASDEEIRSFPPPAPTGRPGLTAMAAHYKLKLTVDTGNHNVLLREAFPPVPQLPQFPRALCELHLDMLSGWWNWLDFSRDLPNHVRLKKCHLRFYGNIHGSTGLAAHRNIFTHPTLEYLTIDNHPGKVDELEPMSLPLTPIVTPLKVLRASGVDVRTLTPALALPLGLQKLTLKFTSPTTNSFVKGYMQSSTALTLKAALGNHFGTLRYIDLHHHCLTEFDWSWCEVLRDLRVHQDHIFSTYRAWTARLRTFLPKTLERLTIHGCDFTTGPKGVCVLETSLLHLVDELEADQLSVNDFDRLKEITLVLAAESPEPTETLKQRCVESHVMWSIKSDLEAET